jgi:hypothetical protein
MRCVGKFTGRLTVTMDFPGEELQVKPDVLQERFHRLDTTVEAVLRQELFGETGFGTVHVTPQLCEVWEENDHERLHQDPRV